MVLTAREKEGLRALLEALLDHDEPVAMLGVIKRIAEVKAKLATKAPNWDAALKWDELAAALRAVEAEIERKHRRSAT